MALLLNQGDVVLRSYSYTELSPTHPVIPEMCGVRTENLYDKSTITSGAYANLSGTATNSSYYCSDFIPITDTTYYFQNVVGGSYQNTVVVYDANKQGLRYAKLSGSDKVSGSITFQSGDAYIRVNCYFQTDVDTVMVNVGSTALPYEPYGYKIQFTCAGQTTPIYLGEVPTIRRIKKLVLTGEENWAYESAYTRFFTVFPNSLIVGVRATPAFCTHFQVISDSRPLADTPNNSIYSNSVKMEWFFKKTDYTTVDEWKSYLSAQYNAGTPVTIWYILSEPQTGIVNEPLAKIGNYTDELTEISVHNLSSPLYGIGDYKDILNLSTGVLTRNIKKFVWDGTERWELYESATNRFFYVPLPANAIPSPINTVCTHYGGNLTIPSQGTTIRFPDRDSTWTTTADFKAFLAAQYANGTPVTIWYVISTPETETVTVPTRMTGEIEGYLTQISTPTPEHPSIPKWNGKEETGGTYAVTVYDLPEIPTTTGKNTLTVETEKIHGLTNPLCGIGNYKDVLNLSTGIITRKIKKLVLTGEETNFYNKNDASSSSNSLYFIRFAALPEIPVSGSPLICTHLRNTTVEPFGNAGINVGSTYQVIYLNIGLDTINAQPHGNTVDGLKEYIASQYAAGTPVTIWYVLETPETETITVPYGLDCTIEGYLTQSGTPTPSNPITPESNGILESDGTYAVEVSLVPFNLTVKGHIK